MRSFLFIIHFDAFDNDELGIRRHSLLSALLNLLLVVGLFFISAPAQADATQISGGLDGRALSQEPLWGAGEEGVRLHGAFVNLRHVISDESGDRYILVGQMDANDNLEELEAYQVYAQVKGPLGRINLRAGRYILPFGLLANLDTERLLIQTQEAVTLGIKLDTGVQVFGYTGPFDYAVSVSQGTGELDDRDSNKLTVARVGMQGEDGRWGLSYMDGQVVTDDDDFLQQGSFDQQRLALDLEIDLFTWLLRGELIAGKEDGHSVYGATLLANYNVNANLTINTELAGWNGQDDTLEMAAGLSYQLHNGLTLRAADTYQRLNGSGEHILALQLYWEFSHAL